MIFFLQIQLTPYKLNLTEFTDLRCRILELVGVLLLPTKFTIYTSMGACVLNPQHFWNPPRIEFRSIRLSVRTQDFNFYWMHFMNILKGEYEAQ